MEHYSNQTNLPENPVFKIGFECKNCGDEFSRKFDSNANVHPARAYKRNFIGIDEVNGNKYVVEIGKDKYSIQCDTCDIDTSLYQLNREPL